VVQHFEKSHNLPPVGAALVDDMVTACLVAVPNSKRIFDRLTVAGRATSLHWNLKRQSLSPRTTVIGILPLRPLLKRMSDDF